MCLYPISIMAVSPLVSSLTFYLVHRNLTIQLQSCEKSGKKRLENVWLKRWMPVIIIINNHFIKHCQYFQTLDCHLPSFSIIYTFWNYTFMTSTWEAGGRVLNLATCLRILLFLNNRAIVHFRGWWEWLVGVGSRKNGHFLWTSWMEDPSASHWA